MTQDPVEAVARAMWRAEAEKAAPNVARMRTAEEFSTMAPATRSHWLYLAQAAIAALQAVCASSDNHKDVCVTSNGLSLNTTEAALADEVGRLRAALQLIASCEKRTPGDVVDIAQKALKAPQSPPEQP